MKRALLGLLILCIVPLASAAECEPGDFRFNIFSDRMDWCVDGTWQSHPTTAANMCIDYSTFKEEFSDVPQEPGLFERIGGFFSGLFADDAQEEQAEENIEPIGETIEEEIIQCFPSPEVCDGKDNDCDDQIDEDYSLATDVTNCGACGVTCPVYNNQVTSCILGECQVQCEDLYFDYDGKKTNGCECAPDEHEPNNHGDDATDLGEIELNGEVTITASTPFEYDADYYKFKALGTGEFTIRATAKGDESQYLELCIFRDEAIPSRMLTCNKGSTSYRGLPQIFARERTYYVQVYPVRKNSCEEYTITIQNQ